MRKRLGIPEGYRRIYGSLVPEEFFTEARREAARIAHLAGKDAASASMPAIVRGLTAKPQAELRSHISRVYEEISTPMPVVFRG